MIEYQAIMKPEIVSLKKCLKRYTGRLLAYHDTLNLPEGLLSAAQFINLIELSSKNLEALSS